MDKIKLLHGKILIKRIEPTGEYKSESGIVIPQIVAEKEETGKGTVLDPNGNDGFYEGQVLVFKTFAGYDVDDHHVAIDPWDVMAEECAEED